MTMRPAVLPLLAVLAALAVSATAEARPLIGLADNRPETLADPRFKATGIKQTRVIVSYDQVRRGGRLLRTLDAYFAMARRGGITPLVSFYRTAACRPECAARRLPSVRTFQADFRRFRVRYPWVRSFSTWNEMNFPAAQPTGRHPERAAQFYTMLRRECGGGRCTVLTGDFRANGSAFSAHWLATFKQGIGGGSHRWGLVPHPEINEFHTRYTRQFLKDTRGPVWATEVGAVNFFGRVHRPSLTRQNKAMRFIMGPYRRVSGRIQRMYVYHWRAAPNNDSWDSALLSARGGRRPAYFTFFRGLGRKAP